MIAGRLAAAVLVLCGLAAAGCSALTPGGAAGATDGRIVSVADGDTVTVRLDSEGTRRVRILSIDSPEKYATRYGSPDECGSLAASAFMERFEGRRVVLVTDPSQDSVDTYGRLLRYVELPGGEDLGAAEVARGLAMPYLFDTPARRYARYRSLVEAARARGRGSWGPPCDGDFHSSVPGVQDGL
ncbi:MAG: thermonuclease family protein [Actinobacteria bacterium]|nr:thermonuclease family protein [Actinomycetota bacterium]